MGQVARLHREHPPLGAHDGRAAEQPGHRRAVEGGGHDEDAQVVAQDPPGLEGQGEAEVGVDAALVELVEDHEPHPLQPRVVVQAAGEDPLGHDLDAGPRADVRFAAHPEADGFSRRLAQRAGHEPGRGARREPPRLEHHDGSAGQPGLVEQGHRHPRRFPGAWGRLQHGAGVRGQRRTQRREGVVDGEGGGG